MLSSLSVPQLFPLIFSSFSHVFPSSLSVSSSQGSHVYAGLWQGCGLLEQKRCNDQESCRSHHTLRSPPALSSRGGGQPTHRWTHAHRHTLGVWSGRCHVIGRQPGHIRCSNDTTVGFFTHEQCISQCNTWRPRTSERECMCLCVCARARVRFPPEHSCKPGDDGENLCRESREPRCFSSQSLRTSSWRERLRLSVLLTWERNF